MEDCCESSVCVVINHTGPAAAFRERNGGSRERKGFMVKVWWAELEQEE